MKKIINIIVLIITLTSCGQKTKTLTELRQQDLIGLWEREGYGEIMKITNTETISYDFCKIYCAEYEVLPSQVALNQHQYSKTSDTTLTSQVGITTYKYNKIESLQLDCSKKKNNNPLFNFDVLTQILDENYCCFKERNVNWNTLKSKYRSKISKTTKQDELAVLIYDMFQEIGDDHSGIGMGLPNKIYKKLKAHKDKLKKKRRKKMLDSLGKDYFFPITLSSVKLKTIKKYVKNVKSYHYGLINYGLINNDIAIIQINGMEELANYAIPEGASKEKAQRFLEKQANKSENLMQDEANGASFIIEKILSEIKNTKTCIIDIRFNGGGIDGNGLEILKRFTTNEALIFTKKAKTKNGFTEKQSIYLKPSKNGYKGKVYLLTSHLTASAAETFTLASMTANPNMIRIGSNTAGVFSDVLLKELPNKWLFALSNEIYESPKGKSYEVTGIEPHYKIDYPKRTYEFYRKFYDNNTGKDPAIEKVFELERQ